MGRLRFSLLGFPVEVQPGFWLLAALIAMTGAQDLARGTALFAVVLASVLVHELGHAAAAKLFGQTPRIALHMMGGLTSFQPSLDLNSRRQMVITASGPAAGFLLGTVALVGLVLASALGVGAGPAEPLWHWVLVRLCFVNFFWSVINLLPVLPFDGGQLLSLALGPRRRMLTATISLAVGLGAAALFLVYLRSIFGAVIFGLGGVSNYLAARKAAQLVKNPEVLEEGLLRAREALDAGQHEVAIRIARAVRDAAPNPDIVRRCVEIAGWAALLSDDPRAALGEIEVAHPVGSVPVDPFLSGAIYERLGDTARAERIIDDARQAGDKRPEVAGLHVRLLLQADKPARAVATTLEILDDTATADARRVAVEAREAGASEPAGELLTALFKRTQEACDAIGAAQAFLGAGAAGAAQAAIDAALEAGLPRAVFEAEPDLRPLLA